MRLTVRARLKPFRSFVYLSKSNVLTHCTYTEKFHDSPTEANNGHWGSVRNLRRIMCSRAFTRSPTLSKNQPLICRSTQALTRSIQAPMMLIDLDQVAIHRFRATPVLLLIPQRSTHRDAPPLEGVARKQLEGHLSCLVEHRGVQR